MRAIEFLKQLPWRKPWTWCGTWGWVVVSPNNVAKVSLVSTSSSSEGRYFHGFDVEIVNSMNGRILKSEYRFQDFLTTRDGEPEDIEIVERHDGTMEWRFGRLPISCHPIVDAIEGHVYIFDEYNRFLNGDE